jgi:hypothetical protein
MKKVRVKYAKAATASAPTSITSKAPALETSSFASLLQQESKPLPQAVHGVVIGKVLVAQNDGSYQIALDTIGIAQVQANAACLPSLLAPGMSIAVMFLQGDTSRPLIIGPMHDGIAPPTTPISPSKLTESTELLVDKERVVIHAEQELELRCGAAAIVLTSDGRILMRGAYISSHATTTQRLSGSSVQIN